MKKLLRTLLCAALLAGLLCTGAQAAGSDISVMLDGRKLTFFEAGPQIVSSRTYLPFRAVFTALGFADEDIIFQPDTRTVRAEKSGLVISMVIGEKRIRVEENGRIRTIRTDVPAFIDPALGRTYVPARFVSEAAGYRVGWDDRNRTVIIDDVDSMMASNMESYRMVEKWRGYEQSVRKDKSMMSGTYEGMEISDGQRLDMKGSFEMYTDLTGAYELDTKMNLTRDEDGVRQPASSQPVILNIRGRFGGRDCFFRAENLKTQQEQGGKDTWFRAELDGSGIGNLVPTLDSAEKSSGRDYVIHLLEGLMEQHPDVPAGVLLQNLNSLLADSSLKTGGGSARSELRISGLRVDFELKLDGENVDGFEIKLEKTGPAAEGGRLTTGMEFSSQDGEILQHQSVTHNGTVMTDMTTRGSYQRSTRTPRSIPGPGSTILDVPSK